LPYKEIHIEKVYFTITEVATQLNVNASLLRYWETEFTFIQPKKNKKGDRLYNKKDIENLKLIRHLLKEKGFTIDGAKKHLKENKNAGDQLKLIQSLNTLKQMITNLNNDI
jgi:DNA-binding transcriptional MerR regulator